MSKLIRTQSAVYQDGKNIKQFTEYYLSWAFCCYRCCLFVFHYYATRPCIFDGFLVFAMKTNDKKSRRFDLSEVIFKSK